MDIVVLNVLYDWFKDNKHHVKFWLLGFTCKNAAIICKQQNIASIIAADFFCKIQKEFQSPPDSHFTIHLNSLYQEYRCYPWHMIFSVNVRPYKKLVEMIDIFIDIKNTPSRNILLCTIATEFSENIESLMWLHKMKVPLHDQLLSYLCTHIMKNELYRPNIEHFKWMTAVNIKFVRYNAIVALKYGEYDCFNYAAKKLSLQPIIRPNEKIINISIPFQVSSSHILLGIYIPYTGDFSVMADVQLSQVNTSNVRYFFMGCNDELYSIHSYDELITQIIVWRAEFELIYADHTYLFTIEPLEYLFILHGTLGTEWAVIRPVIEHLKQFMPAVQIIVNARNTSSKILVGLLEYFKS